MGALMRAKERRRACGTDRSCQRFSHRMRLAPSGNDSAQQACSRENRQRNRHGHPRDVVESSEAAVIDLLLTADCVDLDQLYEVRIGEVCDGRIVEGNVTVLAE